MKANPVGWFEIYVNDMSRAKKFYETVLNVELQTLPNTPDIEMLVFPMDMKTVGAGGALAKMKGVEGGGNSVIVYFTSDDCGQEEKRIEKAGGKVSKGKTSIGQYGFIVLATDTEGNMFGVHSEK